MNYPYLPEGRTIKYVTLDNPFMREAKRLRDEESTDFLVPTGAVVVKNSEIISRAANQTPIKNKKLLALHQKGLCVRRILKVRSGEKYWLCPGCAASRFHAETRSVKDALKHGFDTTGADVYLYGHWWCCKPCWDKMIEAGIRDVYLAEGALELFEQRSYMLKGAKDVSKN